MLRSKVQCNTCGRDMTWSAEPSIPEGFRWRCRRKVAGIKCSESRSIKYGSWFRQSNLTFREILLLTYDIVCREPAHRTSEEYSVGPNTIADWGMFCRETMLVFMAGCSEKLGGPNKTVEIDESKFGRRKYHRGHPVKGQWVFGGVERESGRTFLVAVPDRTADTLVAIIRDWIEPGTSVISDNWAAYCNLESEGFTHRTVNHSIHFVDPDTGAHTNTIKSTWRAVKVFLGQYNRGKTTSTTWHSTCSRRCARQNAFHRSCNSFTSSLTPTGTCAMCHLPPAATTDHTCRHPLQDSVLC